MAAHPFGPRFFRNHLAKRAPLCLGIYVTVLGMYAPLVGSDLAASLVAPAVKLKEIPRASFVQRLAADPFE
jgi:hypothetical protein